MPFKNKNLEKAVELLQYAHFVLKNSPNKGTNLPKFTTSYSLAEEIHNFIKSLEK